MSGRIFPIIASVVLIAIFALLFNFSLPKLEKRVENSTAMTASTGKAKELLGSFGENEKQIMTALPCEMASECPDKTPLKQKLDSNFNSGALKKGLILNGQGKEIFSGKNLDPKYTKLISSAEKNGKAFYKETISNEAGENARTVTVLRLSDIASEKYTENKYLLSLIDNNKLDTSRPKIIYGIATFIPVLIILFYLLLRGKNGDNGGGEKPQKAGKDSQNYLAQIEELKKVNVQQSQFLANFTHELRTPLNSIIGFSGLLKDQTLGNLGNPEYLKYANDINTSGVHLLSLINDILDYSKSEVGKLKVNITEIDVVKVIKQALSIISPRASESKVDLLQSFSSDYFILRLDPKRFKQIMLNLLSNSVKFTPEGGSVTVSVFPDLKGDKVSIEVKDTGVGIAEKDIPTVMSLFGQVETDLNRKYEGTGIGLPFAKKLTALMAGTFELKSKVGEGTSVTLTFPYDKKLNIEYQELYKKQTNG